MNKPTDLDKLLQDASLFRQACYLNGQWSDTNHTSNHTVNHKIPVNNPATGDIIGYVPNFGKPEATQAINDASEAWKDWRKMPAKQRGKLMKRWHDLILENADDLAIIMTQEQGKPLAEAKGEIMYAASFLEWFSEEGKRVYGDTIPSPSPDLRILVTKEPIGVCVAITPWNFPAAMITRKAGAALAAGCPMVVRPSELTPFSALALAQLAERAGIPAGVFQVITGDAETIGAEFTSNPIVRKLSFTGSTRVGKLLMSQCADSIKKVSLELGGNAPFIVFNDADVDKAVQGAMICKFRNAGQTCVCANRLYVQSGVYDEFASKLAKEIESLSVGNGMEEGINIGPMIDQTAVNKVKDHIDDAISKGATVLTGSTTDAATDISSHQLGSPYVYPTLLTGVTQNMKVAKEETFGPLAPLFKFDTEAEVIDCANDTEFGLASYFYSKDMGRIIRVSEALEYGMVGVNTGLISNELAPFGGVKQSGLGREGSKFGIEDYLIIKYTCLSGF